MLPTCDVKLDRDRASTVYAQPQFSVWRHVTTHDRTTSGSLMGVEASRSPSVRDNVAWPADVSCLPPSSMLGARGEGYEYIAYPSAREPRWLIPANTLLRSTSFNLWLPQTRRAAIIKQLRVWGLLPGERVSIRGQIYEWLHALLADRLHVPDLEMAFYLPPRSIYQKLTTQAMTSQGHIIAIAKFASRPSAKQSLAIERNTLETIATNSQVAAQVPQVICWDRLPDTDLLITSAGPMRGGAEKLGKPHLHFLDALLDSFGDTVRFHESSIWRCIQDTFHTCKPHLTAAWCARYERTFNILLDRLGRGLIGTTLAHRDFAPWNTRSFKNGALFVFDWEFARTGYLMNYDHYHFQFMTSMLRNRRSPVRCLPAEPGPTRKHHDTRKAYLLAYLVDLALSYHKMLFGRGGTEDDLVLRQIGWLVDNLDQWLE